MMRRQALFRAALAFILGLAPAVHAAPGDALTPPVLVASAPDHLSGSFSQVAVASSPNGRFVVVWIDTQASWLWAQLFDAAAQPLGGRISVGGMAGVAFDVAMDGDGNFVIVRQSNPYALRGRRFHRTGAAWGPPFLVAEQRNAPGLLESQSSCCSFVNMSMGDAGDFVVTWERGFGPTPAGDFFTAAYFRVLRADGTPLGPIHEAGSGNPRFPVVAADPLGNFIVAWHNDFSISYQAFAYGGIPLALEGSPDAPDTYRHWSKSLDTDGVGNFALAWNAQTHDGQRYHLVNRLARFDLLGQSIEGPIDLPCDHAATVRIALQPAGGAVVLCHGYTPAPLAGFIVGTVHAPGAAQPGPSFPIFTGGWNEVDGIDMDADAGGGFVVAYRRLTAPGSSSIYVQRFSAN